MADDKLVKREQQMQSLVPTGEEWAMWKEVAATLLTGGFAPPCFKTPEQLLAAFLTGREMGIGPMEAKDNLTPMNGRMAPSSALQLSQAYKRLPDFQLEVLESTDKVCVVRARRSPDLPWVESQWTIQEAAAVIMPNGKRLTEKDNWRYYAKDMLYNRAVGRVLAIVVPDTTGPARYPKEVVQDFNGQEVTQPKQLSATTNSNDNIIDATEFKEVAE